ncbi:hypothetical protein D3C87_1436830 [compost metagenome]
MQTPKHVVTRPVAAVGVPVVHVDRRGVCFLNVPSSPVDTDTIAHRFIVRVVDPYLDASDSLDTYSIDIRRAVKRFLP